MAKKKSPSKPLHEPVILFRKRELMVALKVLSEVIQVMGMEFEEIKGSKEMDPTLRKTLMQMTSAHLQNVGMINNALARCWFEETLDMVKNQQLN